MKSHFELLANELIHEIFDYLSSIDLIQSFRQLNKRFAHLLSQRLLKCDFSHLSKQQYEYLQSILPFHQIQSLKISNQWTINFHQRLAFDRMISLQNLTLSHLNYNDLRTFFEHKDGLKIFQQLNSLKIQSTNINSLDRERIFVLKGIFALPKLRLCQLPFIDVNDLDDLTPNLTLDRLLLDHCTMICLGRLLEYIPHVQSLNVGIYTDLQNFPVNPSLITSRTNVRSLQISTINNIPFNQFENLLIRYFPRLEKLIFLFKTDVSSQPCLDYLDDQRWESLLRSFTSLEHFSCSIEFPVQSKYVINSFEKNLFFLQQKWNFIFQIYTYSFNHILRIHTRPYPKRRLDIIPSKAFVDHMNNIYFRVRDLRLLIDTIPIENHHYRYSGILSKNLTSLTLISNKIFNEQSLLIYLFSIINPKTLLYLTIQLDNCSKQFLSKLFENCTKLSSLTLSTYRSWSKLIHITPLISKSSLRSLTVYEYFLDFDQYTILHQLLHQIEIVSIVVASIEDCYRFLTLLFIGNVKKTIEKLRSLTIKCEYDEPDVIAQWIRTNILRKYSYKCTTSVLIMWF